MTDFPVPTGREEAWRFTPTRRLRGLFEPLADGGDGKLRRRRRPARRRHRRARRPARATRASAAIFAPTERVAALAFEGGEAGARRRRPGRGAAGQAGLHRHPRRGRLVLRPPHHQRGQLRRSHRGHRPPRYDDAARPTSRSALGDGAKLTFVSLQDWDDDAVHLEHQVACVGRDATYTLGRRHPRRRPGAHQPDRALRRSRRRRRAARAVLRRRRPAPRAPAARRPRPAALQEPRHLQGRAAGRAGAHGLDRRRHHPRQRRGHRHLRAQPQPAAHRRRPRRQRAQPRDRDRRGRRRGTRVARPAGSTTSSCST